MNLNLTVSKAAISAVLLSICAIAGVKFTNFNFGNNNTNVICSPPVTEQTQPKG